MFTNTNNIMPSRSAVLALSPASNIIATASGSAISTLGPLTAAAAVTAAGMYPVDVMRALTMASAGSGKPFSVGAHYAEHGMQGFVSKGILPEICKSTVMRVSKFFFFPILCDTIFGKTPSQCTVGEKAMCGALATVPEILLISPLEVAKIGMQLDAENKFKNDSTKFLKHIYETRGFNGLYIGWAGMQWRQCFWTGTYFATLGWWKSTLEPPMQDIGIPKFFSTVTAGFFAGFFATFPNAPGDVVRSVIQKRAFADPARPVYGVGIGGIMEHAAVAGDIVKSSGVRGLYTGLGFKAMHLGGSGALMASLIPVFSKLMGIEYGGV